MRLPTCAKRASPLRYDSSKAATASQHLRSVIPDSRPARTKLVASRFMSHSHGPHMVSSKSLMSKTMFPSADAKAPRLRTCASPQSCTRRPVRGNVARSRAINGAAPRKKANGETAMRPYLMGSSSSTRPRFASSSISTGWGRSEGGCQSPCFERGSTARNDFPRTSRASMEGFISQSIVVPASNPGLDELDHDSKPMRSKRQLLLCGRRAAALGLLVRAHEPHSNQPEDHQRQDQEDRYFGEMCAPDRFRK